VLKFSLFEELNSGDCSNSIAQIPQEFDMVIQFIEIIRLFLISKKYIGIASFTVENN